MPFVPSRLARIVSAAGLAAALTVSGVAAQDGGEVSFMVFGDPAELAAYQTLTAAFEEAHPEIDLELIHIPSASDYRARLGVDFAGTVEAVGEQVTAYKPGDEVFGGTSGAFGEYVTVRESRALARKPSNISFEQAAAVPIAAVTALQALRDKGQLQPGQKVLVNGASGGVGTFAVQIARSMGAEVTGVCSTRNLELVRSLGAHRVIDYKSEDYTTLSERYDIIVDNVGNHSLRANLAVLNPLSLIHI